MKNTSLFCNLFLIMVAFFLPSSFVLAQNTEQLPKDYMISKSYILLDGNVPINVQNWTLEDNREVFFENKITHFFYNAIHFVNFTNK